MLTLGCERERERERERETERERRCAFQQRKTLEQIGGVAQIQCITYAVHHICSAGQRAALAIICSVAMLVPGAAQPNMLDGVGLLNR
eukprot:12874375-Heterocapsa_arctica.AAC.1